MHSIVPKTSSKRLHLEHTIQYLLDIGTIEEVLKEQKGQEVYSTIFGIPPKVRGLESSAKSTRPQPVGSKVEIPHEIPQTYIIGPTTK